MTDDEIINPVEETIPEHMQTEEEDEKMPFTMARVDRLLREGLDKRKMIRSEVKEAVNKFLGEVTLDLAFEMNKKNHIMIDLFDFQSAVEKYKRVKTLELEKERLLTSLRKLELDIETLREDLAHRL